MKMWIPIALLAAIGLFSKGQEQPARRRNCANSLRQIGLDLRIWAGDHAGQYPWQVSTNAGGSKEFCELDRDGYDKNSWRDFQVMSNELETPLLLVCPGSTNIPGIDFVSLNASNVTFRVHVVSNGSNKTPMVVCPVDGTTLFYDGSVKAGKPERNVEGRNPMTIP